MAIAGKVLIITGATSGIGEATAREAAKRGAKVVMAARRKHLGEKILAEVRSAGGDAIFQSCDVTKEADVKKLVQKALDTFGRLDGAFNNAGVAGPLGITEDELENMQDFDHVMDVNVRGTFLCMRHQIPAILSTAEKGSIVNNSSVGGLRGTTMIPAYSASKHAVCGMSKSVAARYATEGIRVNTVCPAFFPSELTAFLFDETTPEPDRIWGQIMHPIGRTGKLEEIAATTLWLLSDEAGFITGVDLPVDGGLTAISGPLKKNMNPWYDAENRRLAKP